MFFLPLLRRRPAAATEQTLLGHRTAFTGLVVAGSFIRRPINRVVMDGDAARGCWSLLSAMAIAQGYRTVRMPRWACIAVSVAGMIILLSLPAVGTFSRLRLSSLVALIFERQFGIHQMKPLKWLGDNLLFALTCRTSSRWAHSRSPGRIGTSLCSLSEQLVVIAVAGACHRLVERPTHDFLLAGASWRRAALANGKHGVSPGVTCGYNVISPGKIGTVVIGRNEGERYTVACCRWQYMQSDHLCGLRFCGWIRGSRLQLRLERGAIGHADALHSRKGTEMRGIADYASSIQSWNMYSSWTGIAKSWPAGCRKAARFSTPDRM